MSVKVQLNDGEWDLYTNEGEERYRYEVNSEGVLRIVDRPQVPRTSAHTTYSPAGYRLVRGDELNDGWS